MVLATAAFTSCGGSDTASGKKLVTTILIKSSQDLIDVCDIELTYKGKGGVDVIDTITSTRWKINIFNDSFPTETGLLGYRFLIKPDHKFDKDRCQLDFDVIYMEKPALIFQPPLTRWTQKPIEIDDIASSKVVAYLEMKELQAQMDKESDFFSAHKVILTDGQFKINDIDVKPEKTNEPSKETER